MFELRTTHFCPEKAIVPESAAAASPTGAHDPEIFRSYSPPATISPSPLRAPTLSMSSGRLFCLSFLSEYRAFALFVNTRLDGAQRRNSASTSEACFLSLSFHVERRISHHMRHYMILPKQNASVIYDFTAFHLHLKLFATLCQGRHQRPATRISTPVVSPSLIELSAGPMSRFVLKSSRA